MTPDLPEGFRPLVEALEAHIREAQVRAALAVNRTLLTLYRNIGRAIVERQEAEGWSAKVIDQLADEIQRAFPSVGGFSRPNIYRMRAFYLAYSAEESPSAIVSQAVRQFAAPLPAGVPDLPWGHIRHRRGPLQPGRSHHGEDAPRPQRDGRHPFRRGGRGQLRRTSQ